MHPPSRQELASLLQTSNDNLAFVMKKNVSKEVGNLATQISKFQTDLHKNMKHTAEHHARINTPEGQFAFLKNQNKDFSKEIDSMKEERQH